MRGSPTRSPPAPTSPAPGQPRERQPITLSTMVSGAVPADLLRITRTLITERPLENIRPSASASTIGGAPPSAWSAAIIPWNYRRTRLSKIAPALDAGCTIVLKPSPDTALDPYWATPRWRPGYRRRAHIVLAGPAKSARPLVTHPGVEDAVHRVHRGRADHRFRVRPG